MEFKPYRWLQRLTRQAAAISLPSEPHIRQIHEWYSDYLWVFDTVGSTKAEKILETFVYANKRYGITLFVIDNLAKVGFNEDDYNRQKAFVDQLTDFTKEHEVHVILVLHMRKTMDENKPSGKMDVKGTGAITDMADTILNVWRNKPKEEEIRNSNLRNEILSSEFRGKPDALLSCHKQRNGDCEPKAGLWFDTESHQFLDYQSSRPQPYVKYSQESDQFITPNVVSRI